MQENHIDMSHGSGGKKSHDLIEQIILPYFDNPILDRLEDMAVIPLDAGRIAFTTDSYVVKPIFFKGGDIGKLAVCGTVNDLSMSGAVPLFLSVGLILEEGFSLESLTTILSSMRTAADEAGVKIVTGDTKVVDRGFADGIYINTAGIGSIPAGVVVSADSAKPGDAILISGTIGDHGIAIMSEREGLEFTTDILSDCAPLGGMVKDMLAADPNIKCLRDPTRGGLATTLNELAGQSGVGMMIDESAIPLRDDVRGACEMLGLDPLHIANEGKLIAIVAAENADIVVDAMRANIYGRDAALIGHVVEQNPGRVFMKTLFKATRIVDMLVGEQLPRIC